MHESFYEETLSREYKDLTAVKRERSGFKLEKGIYAAYGILYNFFFRQIKQIKILDIL